MVMALPTGVSAEADVGFTRTGGQGDEVKRKFFKHHQHRDQ